MCVDPSEKIDAGQIISPFRSVLVVARQNCLRCSLLRERDNGKITHLFFSASSFSSFAAVRVATAVAARSERACVCECVLISRRILIPTSFEICSGIIHVLRSYANVNHLRSPMRRHQQKWLFIRSLSLGRCSYQRHFNKLHRKRAAASSRKKRGKKERRKQSKALNPFTPSKRTTFSPFRCNLHAFRAHGE